MGVTHEGPQVMAVLTHLGSVLFKSELRTGAGRRQTQGTRLARTRWPKSGQSVPFTLMPGLGAQLAESISLVGPFPTYCKPENH